MNIEKNKSLRSYNSFGIEAIASSFGSFDTVAGLEELLHQRHEKLLVLGGGSNILLTKDFDGIVLKNDLKGINVLKEDETHVYVQAGAGESWHQFVLYCIDHGFAGVENLSLIPGNVGASPMQNIGAYGVELKDVFHSLEAWHIADNKLVHFTNADCGFGYRDSVFKNIHKGSFVILSVTFVLKKNPAYNISYGALEQELERMGVKELTIKAISDAVIHIRRSKLPDPAIIGNAGSFFKNPSIPQQQYEALRIEYPNMVAYPQPGGLVKLAAGWLIESCGWKGYRKGDAGCHEKQALVLVNYGNASGKDIFDLSQAILRSVEEKFGVLLEREVNIV